MTQGSAAIEMYFDVAEKFICLIQELIANEKVQLGSTNGSLLKDSSFVMQLQDFILIFDPMC